MCSLPLRRVGKLVSEIGDGFCVNLALVPLLEDGEVGAARIPTLPALPPIAGEEIRGRGQHIGRAAEQVTAAVGVEIDGELNVGRWHELGLADFTSPCAAHFAGG